MGRRLKHVKENDLAHGEFGKWLDEIGMNDRVARMMMTVANELDSKRSTYSEIGLNALYQIATLPPDQRDQPHVIPSTGEIKTVDEMTAQRERNHSAGDGYIERCRAVNNGNC
ncbi:DUF3102 domain-containing protein [Caldifermentibacillus hisashii]|uniref:DUF3102 domain-containing protein n=1 Tax=Caldifermentibacillus hisashii TaxID=996558 RepID=UPI003D154BC9